MPDILVNLPNISSDQYCTPTDTLNRYYCFYLQNNNGRYARRATILIDGDKAIITSNSDNYQTGYDISQYPTRVYQAVTMRELSQFWFPLISVFCVGLIFFFVYKIMFSRFIK